MECEANDVRLVGARCHTRDATDNLICGYWAETTDRAQWFLDRALSDLRKAASELGYDLVPKQAAQDAP